MSTIGSLSVNVVANTEKFSKGMKTARTELSAFGKAGEFVNGHLKGLIAGFAGMYSASAVIGKLGQAAEDLVKLGHTAETLNLTTQALGGLEHAGIMAHVSTEQLTKGLTYMEKNLVKNSAAVEGLGLNVYRLKQMNADQIFLDIAGAINKLPKGPEQIAAITSIFGKGATVGGAGISRLIHEGPESIRAAISEAAEMGLAPTKEEIKELEKLDQTILRIKEHARGTWQQLAMKSAPIAEKAVDIFSLVTGGAGALGDNLHRGHENQSAFVRLIGSMSEKDFDVLNRAVGGASGTGRTDGEGMSRALRAQGFKVDNVIEFSHIMEAIEARNKQARADVEAKIHPPDMSKIAGSNLQTSWDDARSAFSGLFSGGSQDDLFSLRGAYAAAGMAPMNHPQVGFGATDSEMTDIANRIDQMGRPWLDHPMSNKLRQVDQVQGNAALEEGSAAAFSQGRRSSQAASSMLDVQKKSLDQQQKQLKVLQNIDKGIQSAQKLETVNIA